MKKTKGHVEATLNDAIYCVRSQLGQGECKDCRLYKRRGSLDLCDDVNEVILAALEEVKQYREIGLTPQMVKDLIKSEKQAHRSALENAEKLDEHKDAVYGEWVCLEEEIGLFECSECGHKILRAKCNFCPNCGRPMKGDEQL